MIPIDASASCARHTRGAALPSARRPTDAALTRSVKKICTCTVARDIKKILHEAWLASCATNRKLSLMIGLEVCLHDLRV